MRAGDAPSEEDRAPRVVRLYRRLLALLPASVRVEDGEEMARALQDQMGDAGGDGVRRLAIAWRAFRRLPGVVMAEWMDVVVGPGHGAGVGTRRGGGTTVDDVARHLRFAMRTLRKSPAFSWAAILLIGVGVGTVTTAFTVVDHVILRPLPYPAPDRLAYLTNGAHNGATLRGLDDVAAVESWTATTGVEVNLTTEGAHPLRLRAVETTPSFFPLFGARPAVGRLLVEADYDDPRVVVLTHEVWTTVWGGEPDVVGSTIRLDGDPHTVVGVLSAEFTVPEGLVGRRVELFRPMDWTDPRLENPGFHAHSVVVRLGRGTGLEEADGQITALARRVAGQYPDYYEDGPPSWPLQTLEDRTVRDISDGLVLLAAAVGLLLLVACANVAHLFMARSLGRAREMAVRRAMGAGTRVLVGQLLVESLVVGLAGGLLGLVFAVAGLEGLGRWVEALPRGEAVGLDLRVLAFAAGLAGLTALVFGLLPALQSLGTDVAPTLRRSDRGATGARGTRLLRSGLVAGEVALSLVLVALAGVLVRSFLEVTRQDPGLDPEGVWVVPLTPSAVETVEDYRLHMGRLAERLETVRGVESVTWVMEAPFEYVGGNRCCWSTSTTDGEGGEEVRTVIHAVTGEFFRTFGTDLLAGRSWDPTSVGTDPPPVVVSEALAVRLYGSAERAVGREIGLPNGRVRVSGVAEATLHYGLDRDHGAALYLPVEELPFPIPRATLAFRSSGSDAGLAGRIREAVWSVEPGLPVPEVARLSTWIEESSSSRRFASTLSSGFGLVALLLAAGGLYGTLLYTVGQRRRELGIRLALGEGRWRIQGRIVGRGVATATLGVVVGALLAWFGGRLLESQVFGVSPQDPLALGSAAAVLLVTAALACWLPARKAARTDPLEALRVE